MIEINLKGFYQDPQNLPNCTGIYVVFACQYNPKIKFIISARPLYIGKADNIHDRHFKGGSYCHEHFKDFQKHCSSGETIYYCFAHIDGRSLPKVENALIAMQRPPINIDGKNSYNHLADYFKITGAGAEVFRLTEFGFSKDYDINSLYTEDEIDFE